MRPRCKGPVRPCGAGRQLTGGAERHRSSKCHSPRNRAAITEESAEIERRNEGWLRETLVEAGVAEMSGIQRILGWRRERDSLGRLPGMAERRPFFALTSSTASVYGFRASARVVRLLPPFSAVGHRDVTRNDTRDDAPHARSIGCSASCTLLYFLPGRQGHDSTDDSEEAERLRTGGVARFRTRATSWNNRNPDRVIPWCSPTRQVS